MAFLGQAISGSCQKILNPASGKSERFDGDGTQQRRGVLNRLWANKLEYALIGVYAFLILWKLGLYPFWSDEAETALFARAVLRTGLPMGFDGQNVFEFYGGIYLNPKFVNVTSPWLQFYTAAAAMAIGGKEEWILRFPFALAGIVAGILGWRNTRKLWGKSTALIFLILLATNVQQILYMRQCRYYALSQCLEMLVLYFLLLSDVRKRRVLLGLSLVYILSFLSNPVVGFACIGGLLAANFLVRSRKQTIIAVMIPGIAAVFAIGLFMAWIRRNGTPKTGIVMEHMNPVDTILLSWKYLQDFSMTGLLPYGLILFLPVAVVAARYHRKFSVFRLSRPDRFIIAAIVAGVYLTSMLCIMPRHAVSDIRYSVPLFPLLLMLQAAIFAKLLAWNRLGGSLLLGISIFLNPLSGFPPRSYLWDYVREQIAENISATETGVHELHKRVRPGDTVLVCPNYMLSSVAWYLDGKVRFCGVLSPTKSYLLKHKPNLPPHTYSDKDLPQWVIWFGSSPGRRESFMRQLLLKITPDNYDVVYKGFHGIDMTRPELAWREFYPIEIWDLKDQLQIWRLKDPAPLQEAAKTL
jgi:hypothetical protein